MRAALTPEKMRLIGQLEKPTLLLVPDGMSLSAYLAKAGEDKTGQNKQKLPWNKANDIDTDSDKNGELISDAVQYGKANHGGKTKAGRLAEPGALGWQVYAVDGGDDVPQSTLNRKADDLIADFRAKGFGGLSAEANFALQMYGQIRGQQFDEKYYGWLLESYLTAIGGRGVVLFSNWFGSNVYLNGDAPVSSGENLGARRSVRVL